MSFSKNNNLSVQYYMKPFCSARLKCPRLKVRQIKMSWIKIFILIWGVESMLKKVPFLQSYCNYNYSL